MMREVSLDDLPEVGLSSLSDSPAEIGLSELPEVDLSALEDEAPDLSVFGGVAPPTPVTDYTAELQGILDNAGTVSPRQPMAAADAAMVNELPGSQGRRPPQPDYSGELQGILDNAGTVSLPGGPAPSEAAAVSLLPAAQRATAVKSEPYIPETQGPLYEPTKADIAKREAGGFVRGLTAGALGPSPEEGGLVGDIAGAALTNLLPYLATPAVGAAINTYYAYLRDLNEQADQGASLGDMNQKRALARAAVALAFAKIPGAVGKDPFVKGLTGAAIGAGGNVADVAAAQLAETGTIDPSDPNYAEQYKQAAALGAAIGGPVGAIAPSYVGETGIAEAAPRTPREIAPTPIREVGLSALPEAPAAAVPEAFSDADIEAAYNAQYEPTPQAPPTPPPLAAVEPPASAGIPAPEVALSALPEAIPEPPAQAIPGKAGEVIGREKGRQGQTLLNESLKPEYQRLAIRIAREQPNLSEEQAMAQAFVIQRGDAEAIARGAGEAVESRRIEFQRPPEKTDISQGGLSLNEYIHANKPKIRLTDEVRDQLGLWDGQAGFKKPRPLSKIREDYGDIFTNSPDGKTLDGIAERIRELAHDGGLQLSDVSAREVGYNDVVSALSEGRPIARRGSLSAENEYARSQGYDEATLSGKAPGYKEVIATDNTSFDGKNILDENGNILFQKGRQRDLFGGEAEAPKPKAKIEQTDMFGNEGYTAGKGLLKGGEKGLEGTPLQKQADVAARNEGQQVLLQEGRIKKTDTPEFKKWFGESKVVDESGKPLVLYHGTRENFDSFNTTYSTDMGSHFGTKKQAHDFVMGRDLYPPDGVGAKTGGNIMPVYLSIKKPLRVPDFGAWDERAMRFILRKAGVDFPSEKPLSREAFLQYMENTGYDGLVYQNIHEGGGKDDSYVVFKPEQIKSATGNRGTFDPESPSILEQERGKVTKGQIEFTDDGTSTITVFSKHADFSTLLHEYGHWLRRKSLSPAEQKVLEKWIASKKIKVLDEDGLWTREAEEEFAKAFERYLRDRTAPTSQLKTIFEKVRQFMRLVYKQVRNADAIPPHIRKVYDALLGFKNEEGVKVLKQEAEAPQRPLPYKRPPETAAERQFRENPPKDPGAPPPKVRPKPGDVGGLEGKWDVADETRFDYFLRRVQDKMRPLKLIQRGIQKAGRRISESTDAYLAEELYHGKAGAALRNADKEIVEPLLKEMKTSGFDLPKVDEFLYARHAMERNAQIEKINPDPDKGSGMTNDQAQAILDKARKDGSYAKLEKIGKMVDELNQKRLDMLESSGLISTETRKTWEDTYKHYVPLKGFAEAGDTPQQVMDYHLGKGFDVRGTESRRALGRKSLADSPLATAIAQLNESIVRAHKNQVSKAFLKLVLDNPNKDIWEVNKTEFRQSLENGIVVQRQVVNKNDPNVMTAKVLGKEYYVIMRPKYTALAQAMKNMGEERSDFFVRTLGKANKVLALVNTTLSPEFVLSNFLRDAQTAGINMAGENGSKFAAKVAKDALPAMRGVLQGIRDSKVLVPSKSVDDWAGWYKRFEKAGGKTEYLGLKSIDDIKTEFESKLGKPTAWGRSKEGVKWLANQVEDINTAVENSIRLSAFKNGVEAGLSEAKAASLAKNLTVNFNRKGELGTLANSLYLFFNANVQGTARIMAAMAKPNTPAGKKLWGIAFGLAGSSWGLAEWNRAIAGEDDDGVNRYDKIAPFVKERNIIIAIPESKGKEIQYLTIPIPYGYNVFNVIGESISSWNHGGETLDGALNIGQALAGAFNPLGSESSRSPAKWITKMATPTIADPVVQYAMNEAFTGAPIKPENLPYGTPKPESQLAFKSVSPMARAAAEKLNAITGGSEYRSGTVDISPEAMEHFVTSYTGSLGKFIYNTIGYTGGLVSGADADISKTPFARRFFMGESEYFDQKSFADNAREYKPFLEEAKSLSGEESNKFEAEFGPQIELAQMARSIQKQVERLNKQAKGIRRDNGLTEAAKATELKVIEKEKNKLFKEFNRAVHERKRKPSAVQALP